MNASHFVKSIAIKWSPKGIYGMGRDMDIWQWGKNQQTVIPSARISKLYDIAGEQFRELDFTPDRADS